MASAGRVLIIPRGAWNADVEYGMLDLVTHNEKAWISREKNKGEEPVEGSAYWQGLIMLPIANDLTTETEGYLLDATQGRILSERCDTIAEKFVVLNGIVTQNNESYTHNFEVLNDNFTWLKNRLESLENKVDSLPSITSGTSEPSGGEDGDIYIMHE